MTRTLLVSLALAGCATHTTRLDAVPASPTTTAASPLSHRIVLIGDAGALSAQPVLDTVGRRIRALSPEEQAKTTVLFLGDNVYPSGLPRKDHGKRDEAEAILDAQADLARDFAGRVLMVPGNHDAVGSLVARLERQERYFEKAVTKARGATERIDAYLPSNACGGPVEVDLSKEVLLVAVSTPWYLDNWDNARGRAQFGEEPATWSSSGLVDCQTVTRRGFDFNYELMIRGNRNRRVIVAGHHPPASYGRHGGKFSAGDFFLPQGLGPLLPLARIMGFIPHDLAHPRYRAYANMALAAAQKNGRFVFVGGHDHTLQHIEIGAQTIVVSGSAAKQGVATLGKNARFVSGEQGFAELIVEEGGAGRVTYLDAAGKQLFARALPELETPTPVAEREAYLEREGAPAVHPPISDATVDAGVSKKKMLIGNALVWAMMGRHHRRVFEDVHPYPSLDLATFEGGADVLKAGGGAQTNSLRLMDAYGQQWTLRATTKDASRVLPYPLNRVGFAVGIAEDMFTATHPHAALIVPELASAIGILHTSPRLVYVPAQEGLGSYARLVENEVALLERRPEEPEVGQLPDTLGGERKAYSTPQLLERWKDDPRRHRIDEAAVVRNRLFDILLGDFDRHDDQWRWSRSPDGTTDGGKKRWLYTPIPRDRDQVMSNYDGLAPALARVFAPPLRQMRPMMKKVRNPKWATFNGRVFDETFMPSVDRDVFLAQARHIQDALTDAVIERAIGAMPPKVAELDGAAMAEVLRRRRDRLETIADRYFEQVNRVVEVTGSQKGDRFTAEYTDDGLRVRGERISKKGKAKGVFYERTFRRADTREVRLYGLGGDDQFAVSGRARRRDRLRLRLVGGSGDDRFEDTSRTPGPGRSTLVYDSPPRGKKERALVTRGPELADRRSRFGERNTYYRRDRHYELDWSYVLPSVGVRREDGALIGAMAQYTDHGFKRDPYAARHKLKAAVASATLGVEGSYTGEFIDVLGRWNLEVMAHGNTPQTTATWFGLGNTAEVIDDIAFHRVRRETQGGRLALEHGWARDHIRFRLETGGLRTRVEATPGRFVEDPDSDIDPRAFNSQIFTHLATEVTFDGLDNHNLPRRGVMLTARAEGRLELTDLRPSLSIDGMFAAHTPIGRRERWVYGTALQFGMVAGDYDYFHVPSAGGTALRGYFEGQVAGDVTLVHQNDVRLQVIGQPGSSQFVGGLSLSVDHGRTWAPQRADNTWHVSAGGGAWFGIAQTFGLSIEAFATPEFTEGRTPRVLFSLGPLHRRTRMVSQ